MPGNFQAEGRMVVYLPAAILLLAKRDASRLRNLASNLTTFQSAVSRLRRVPYSGRLHEDHRQPASPTAASGMEEASCSAVRPEYTLSAGHTVQQT